MKLIRDVMRKETNTKVVSNTVELKKKKKKKLQFEFEFEK